MAKIVKSDKAPEGPVTVSLANTTFDASDGYETDDLDFIAYAESDDYLEVVYEEAENKTAVVREESKEQRELLKAQDAADKKNAERKDPRDPLVPRPDTIEELHELQAQKEDDK